MVMLRAQPMVVRLVITNRLPEGESTGKSRY
jgi:hypothetical protein